jgi:hypothetical protein
MNARKAGTWCGVAVGVVLVVGSLWLFQNQDGRDLLLEVRSSGNAAVDRGRLLAGHWMKELVGIEDPTLDGATTLGVKVWFSHRRTWRFSNRVATVKVQLDGAERISEIRLLAAADGNGDRRISHSEWTLVGVASQEKNGVATTLSIPETEIGDDSVAFQIVVDGEPFKSIVQTVYPTGIEIEDR